MNCLFLLFNAEYFFLGFIITKATIIMCLKFLLEPHMLVLLPLIIVSRKVGNKCGGRMRTKKIETNKQIV